jgi:hypothetical protein
MAGTGSLKTGGLNLATERRFFAWLSVAILAMAVAGFLRSYVLLPVLGLPEDSLAPTALVHIHAAIFFAWCVLLAVQCWLVVANRGVQHRQLGMLGLGLYAGLVITGPLVALRSVARYGTPPDELSFLAVSLGNVLAYTLVLGAAFLWRRLPAIHKRLMMIGMVTLLSAPFGRLIDLPYQLPHVVGPGLVVLALAIWDRAAHGRIHPVTGYGGVVVLLWELAPNLYMYSNWWMSLSRWLVEVAT